MAKRRKTNVPEPTGDKAWDSSMKKYYKKYGNEEEDVAERVKTGLSQCVSTMKPFGKTVVAVFLPGEVELNAKGRTTKVSRIESANVVILTFPDDPAEMSAAFSTAYKQLEQVCRGHEKAFAAVNIHIQVDTETVISSWENGGGVPVGEYWTTERATAEEQAMMFFGQVLAESSRDLLGKTNDKDLYSYLLGCLVQMASYIDPNGQMSKIVRDA